MHRAIYPLKWDVAHRQQVHKKKLRKARPRIDNEAPKPHPHLITKAKKHELEEDRFAEIERENAVLLAKMSKIIRDGSGSHNSGGAPERSKIKPTPPKSLNEGYRRKELAKITQENLGILKRIQMKDPFYNHLDWEEQAQRNKQIMHGLCEFKKTTPRNSKFVSNLRQNARKGSQTARGPNPRRISRVRRGSGSVTSRSHHRDPAPPSPIEMQEHRVVRVDDIKLLLGMRRPPDLVKKVFSALMLLVSPFETSEADLSWDAVQQWLAALQGVEAFVDNLNHFDVSSVDPKVISRTVDYLICNELRPQSVELFSKALSSLCEWIWRVCEESVPGVCDEREEHALQLAANGISEDADEPDEDCVGNS